MLQSQWEEQAPRAGKELSPIGSPSSPHEITGEKYVALLKDHNKGGQVELDEAMESFYQGQMVKRTQALTEIQKTVSEMMMTSKAEAASQTDGGYAGEMHMQQEKSNDYRSDNKVEESSKDQRSSLPRGGKTKAKLRPKAGQPPTAGMLKYNDLQRSIGHTEADTVTSGVSQLSPSSNGFDQGSMRVTNFNVPHENTNVDYGWAKVQVSLVDREKTAAFERKLNARFEQQIAREVEKSRERGKEDLDGAFGATSWSLPSHVVSFLSNSI